MILRRNQDLFNTIKALAGVNDFTDNEITDLVSFTNRRLSMAYNTTPMWERYIVISEERTIAALNLSNFTSSVDQAFNDSYKVYPFTQQQGGSVNLGTGRLQNTIYQSITDSTKFIARSYSGISASDTTWEWQIGTFSFQANDDGTVVFDGGSVRAVDDAGDGTIAEPWNVVTWDETNGGAKTIRVIETPNNIPYTQTGRDTIQDFIRIHRVKAFKNNSATEYDFYVDVNGASILNSSAKDGVAFVTYKKPIVNTTTGQIITSLDTTATSNYLTEIPLEFFNYTAHGVYADFLRMDGQHDKAAFEEQKADMFLATELERIDIINNNNSLNHKFSTYVNTSSR